MTSDLASIRVLADDLTGAADAGIAFAGPGRPVTVLLDARDTRWNQAVGAGIRVLDTDTRAADPAAARSVIDSLVAGIGDDDLVLNKIDSLLRGNVRVGIAALRDRFAHRPMIIAAALPAAGRTTRGAVQHLHGLPLHHTDAWAAEKGPAPAHLAEVATGTTVDLESVRGEPGELAQRLADIGTGIALADAETAADLRSIVRAGRSLAPAPVWVGSAGLAAALAAELFGPARPECLPARPSRYLAVLGSASSATRRQAMALIRSGALPVELSPAELLDPAGVSSWSAQIVEQAGIGDVVVTVSPDRHPDPDGIAAGLAMATAAAVATSSVLVLAGGAIARTVLTRNGIRALDLVCEPEPGVVVSTSAASTTTGSMAGSGPSESAGRLIVTKSGSFGDDLSLVRVLAAITAGRAMT